MRSNRNIIGRLCVVRDTKFCPATIVEAMAIDHGSGVQTPKRMRLQTGEHFGEVRMPGEYELLEFVESGEAPSCIAAAWAEPVFS